MWNIPLSCKKSSHLQASWRNLPSLLPKTSGFSHPGNTAPLPARLKTLGIFLRAAYRYFKKSTQTETSVSHTAESLLDNFDIIQGAPSP